MADPTYNRLEAEKYLLNQLNAGSQVHPKVNECPFNSFLLVLLLLQHEHVVVEELLQFLIGEVDTQLLKAVELPSVKTHATFSRFSNNSKVFSCAILLQRR